MKRLSTYPLRSLLASPLGTPPPGAQGHQELLRTAKEEACRASFSRLWGQWGETEAPGLGGAALGIGGGRGRAEGLARPPLHCCHPGCRTGGQSPPSPGLPGGLSVSLEDGTS